MLNRIFAVVLMVLFIDCATIPSEAASNRGVDAFRPATADVVRPEGWPAIGKWMITPDLLPAHWLGESLRNKHLREPINVIIVDRLSKDSGEAKKRFRSACEKAGFPSRTGHSSGYWAWVGDHLQPQFPDERSHAFSDEPFELNNNHGRFFGPFRHGDRFLFVGSLSREKVVPLASLKHQYVSFNMARDVFASRLDARSDFHVTEYLNLNNALVGHPELTTGDHDQMAVVLSAQ